MHWPSHLPCFHRPNNIWRGVQSRISSLRNFLNPPVTSSLLGSNILLSSLFSNILSLYFFDSERSSVTSVENNRQHYTLYI
jgi:hypothetical protein